MQLVCLTMEMTGTTGQDALGQVIATRVLIVDDQPGIHIVISLGQPRKGDTEQGDYICPYQINGVGLAKVKYAVGMDTLQAIQFAIDMIGADVSAINRKLGGKLSWLEPGHKDLGLPQ